MRCQGPGIIRRFCSPSRQLKDIRFQHYVQYEPRRLVVDGVVFATWTVEERNNVTCEVERGTGTKNVPKVGPDEARTPSTEELEDYDE